MLRIFLLRVKMYGIMLFCAGFFRVTARKSEQGFCVKAVRKPVGCFIPQPVWQSPSGTRPAGQNIRTINYWSSSQNNNNNAWNQNFNNGNRNNNNKNNTNTVRAVRGFTQNQMQKSQVLFCGTVPEFLNLEQSPFL